MQTEIEPSDNKKDSKPLQPGEVVYFLFTDSGDIANVYAAEVTTIEAELGLPVVRIRQSRTFRKGNGWHEDKFKIGQTVLLDGIRIIRNLDEAEKPPIIQIGPKQPKGRGEVSFVNLDPGTGIFHQVVQTEEDPDSIKFIVCGASNGDGWRRWTPDKTTFSIDKSRIKRFSLS